MINETFSKWLQERINSKGYNQAELARRANVSRAAINGILTGSRGIGNDLCSAIARGLELPEIVVFIAAGIIKSPPGYNEDLEVLTDIFTQMTDDEQEEFLAAGKLKIDLRMKRGDRETPQAKPAHI